MPVNKLSEPECLQLEKDRELLNLLWDEVKRVKNGLYQMNLHNQFKPVIYTTMAKELDRAIYTGSLRTPHPGELCVYGACAMFMDIPIYEVNDKGNSHSPWRIALVEIK